MTQQQQTKTIELQTPLRRVVGWLCLPFALLALAMLFGFVWGAVTLGFSDFVVGGMAASLVMALPLCLAVHGGLVGTKLTMGVDGLFIQQGLSGSFFGYADISSVHELAAKGSSENDRIRVHLRNGRSFIKEQISDAEACRRQAEDLEQDLVVNEPKTGHRLGELRKLGSERDYREGVVTADRLEPIMASAGCSPVARAAAAIALDGHEGSDNRRKLRVAADGYAQPKVRKRLLRIAEADSDEELAAQLEALAALEKKTQRRA